MEYMIRARGVLYRVPEEMLPRVAQAMVDGGTAVRLDPPKVEASVLDKAISTAARIIAPVTRALAPNRCEPRKLNVLPVK